ncbi:hypothetical protein NKI79_22705 [Mesorhizobium sp. M0340]|uniref:hypothetical protein n=1 Tax=Mesorhizobium sp. M0340 TaxID=2956939 RepID=UPI00333A3A3B
MSAPLAQFAAEDARGQVEIGWFEAKGCRDRQEIMGGRKGSCIEVAVELLPVDTDGAA